jgi:outer membrane protein OmpA-like peptidoglycan-associated protein/tetratricopeptide (TPR) repeat protein
MKNLAVILLSVITLSVVAQKDIPFEKSNFKDKKEAFKKAYEHYLKGEAYYNQNNYYKALEYYLKANEFNANSSELNAKIGDCYLHTYEKIKAIPFFEKAKSLNSNLDGFYLYLLGTAYHLNNDFDKAIKTYRLAKSRGSKINPPALDMADKKIKECNTAKKMIQSPVNVKIINLGEGINTIYEEYVPVITADESEIYFTSRRPETTGRKFDPNLGDYYEDIYHSVKEDTIWQEAENVGKPINSEFHDATVGLSLDGQKLFIYRDGKNGDGDIYYSELKGKKWGEPQPMPKPINSKGQETSACFDYTGNVIYFVSDRDGGEGGRDIYKSVKQADGTWGEAENLGPIINTEYDEDAVFMHPDGKTLYFCSNGHDNMGGFDVFKSEFENGKWSKPKNLGYPINTTDDDVSFVLTASGEYGYYTSGRIDVESYGKRDIYKIAFLDVINRPKLTLLKGKVTDRETGEPIAATIEIYDNTNNQLVSTYTANSATGKFMVSLPSGKDYGINVSAPGYLFYSDNINIPLESAFQEVEKNIELDKLKVGKKVQLSNIFYDYNSAKLRESSYNELDKVVELLNKNPKLKIEISSHTDSRGSDAYNLKLSQERAQSCVDYLVSKGVDKNRLIAKGYGESKPLITDEEINKLPTEEEKEAAHQKNRRTEFKILEN